MSKEVSGITFYILIVLFACGVVAVGYRDLRKEYADFLGVGGDGTGKASLTRDLHGTYTANKGNEEGDEEKAGSVNSFLRAIAP